MHRKKQLSPTHEMYLKVLYNVREEYEVARVRDIAKGLGISPGTVSSGLKLTPISKLNVLSADEYQGNVHPIRA